MAESICNVNTANVGMFSKPEVWAAKIKNCNGLITALNEGKLSPDTPIFSPEGPEGAQKYVNKNFPQCKAVSDGLIADIYKVDCSRK